ncbi:MAG: TonB-dependent receptor [Sphingobacteriales bacterium]|nr:TonB-dependent receptor [Sphingobacteriales bacterium]
MNQKLILFRLRYMVMHIVITPLLMLLLLMILALKAKATNKEHAAVPQGNIKALTVHGTVMDKDGNALAGVNVNIKGAGKGTVTDNMGQFTLPNVSEDAILVFSFVGYQSQETTVNGKTEISMVLLRGSQTLEEVVVMGYGKQKKKLVTGATVEIKGDDIQKRAAVSPLSAMQGQAPGVSITSTGGQPGSGFRVNIRGAGTVGETTPLYIVDGVQTSDISYLSNNDIASIDILKDAASAAIYGARAANGVILITTKTGSPGFSQISFDSYYGIQNTSKKIKVLGGQEYMDMMNEMYTNSNLTPIYTNETINKKILSDAGGGTNWMDLLLAKNVPMQNYNLSGQGGTEKSVYAMSLSYTQQGGIVGGADLANYKRITFRINTEHKLYKDIVKMGQHLSYSNATTIGASYPIVSAIRVPSIIPNLSPDDPSRFYYNNVPASGGDNIYGLWSTEITNPYASMLNSSYNRNRVNKVIGDVYFDVKLIGNLHFKTTLTLDYSGGRSRSYQPVQPDLSANSNAKTGVSQVTQSSSESVRIGSENILTYTAKNNKDHKFDALAGMSALKTNTEYLSASNKNLLYTGYDYAWLNNATGTASSGTMSMSGYPGEDALLSYFGRVNYDYKGTYLATVILRSDGSSRFDKSHRRGYFPSFSAGWNISNESFMEPASSWLPYLKVRGSWGQNGNMNIPPYYYLALVGSNFPYSFGDDGNAAVGAALTNLGNASLHWEKAQSTNIGFDARLLKGQLGFTFDWYHRETKDWLVQANIPSVYGVGAPYINGGNVINRGIEMAATYSGGNTKSFSYNISANIAFNNNKVSAIPTQDGILHGGGGTLYANSVEVTRSQNGYPLGFFWGLTTDGIFQTAEEVQNYKGSGGNPIQPNAQPGDLRYVDRNGDGTINALDKSMIGDGHPDAIFGLTCSFAYKGFDLYIATNGVAGNQILQNYIDANRNYWNITQDLYDGRWHGAGTSNKYPRIDAQNSNWINFSDVFLYKGDYIKINNVTLGYDFARHILKTNKISQLRVYITGQNLYNFTSYNGMDPEIGTGSNGVDQSEIGRDSGMYPHARTILFGLSVKF